ncbi:cyclic nucleotide-binding domain-containing protein [Moraxella catarrhalis]|uniref:cyclic nucleotide-binding domain-containing protein n=1 Tax=Moraxella catarrhalis TaxID=480 RepID=UPI0007F41701|nr:cyclic nucleotide-binding domain-containing protein [Moraxella catarrhalis]OAV04262.1 putative signal-transduction protein [Moraxella catarrhalis]
MNRFDFSTAPYNTLTNHQRQVLEKATDIVFFDDNTAIIEAQDSIDTYIIIKGMVKEIDAGGEILALYHPSDSFDTQALFEQSYRHSFIAVKQSLRYAQNHHPYAHRRKQRIWCLLFCQYCR